MRTRGIAIGLLTALAATPAIASPPVVLYDTLHASVQANSTLIVNPLTGPEDNTRGGPIAFQFDVTSPTTLGALQLQLNSFAPTDGNFLNVYLVPDNAGSPSYTGTGATLAFSGATLLASIADSLLPLAANSKNQGATITLNLPSLLPLSAGEYWIGLTNPDGEDNFVFDNTSYLAGIGTAGQSDFFQAAVAEPNCVTNNVICGAPGVPTLYTLTLGQNVYEAALYSTNIPEPASLAILGAGLAGMGIIRRRRASRPSTGNAES